MGLEHLNPEFVARAAPKVMPDVIAGDPGAYQRVCRRKDVHFYEEHDRAWRDAPWTYEKFLDYAMTLDFASRGNLEGKFDKEARDERARAEALARDPVYMAERQLGHVQCLLEEERKKGLGCTPLASIEQRTAQLEAERASFKHDAKLWLAFTRDRLDPWRIEGERQALLARENEASIAKHVEYVANARAALEAAKQEQAQREAATQAAE